MLKTTVRMPPLPLLKLDLGARTVKLTNGHPLWISGKGWTKARDIADLKGQTVCLVCVQAACRASSTHALPMVTALSQQYAADDAVKIVVVQTAFRDFRSNSLANAKRLAKSLPDTVAVGHTGDSKHRPAVLDNYGIAGTPWVVIIDASGNVAFSAVHLRVEQVGRIIDGLKQPKTELTDADSPLLSE
ncbi:MAG: hypothetical protein ABGZ17_21560 [Planctomycetaceae bacterium]